MEFKKKLWVVLLTELVATYLFIFWILMPGSLGFGTNPNFSSSFNDIYNLIFGNLITKALYVTLFLSLILYIFRGISCNINPVVTLSQYFLKRHDGKKATLMITVQFIAGIFAALTLYLIASSGAVNNWTSNSSLSSVQPKFELSGKMFELMGIDGTYIDFNDHSISNWQYLFSIVTILLEAAGTLILLISINYCSFIKHSVKPLFISLCLTGAVIVGLNFNTMCFNPARMIGPAIVSHIFGDCNNIIYIPIFLTGEVLAALYFLRREKE